MQRKIVFFIVIISLLGCSRFLVPKRSVNSARYNICVQGGDCGVLMVAGDTLRLRIQVYGSMGVKLFDGYISNDSFQVVYAYDKAVADKLDYFLMGRNLSAARNFLGGLLFGFDAKDVIIPVGQSPKISSCIGLFCYNLTFKEYALRSNHFYLNEGQLNYGTSVIWVKSY